jgi:hypothetical protein
MCYLGYFNSGEEGMGSSVDVMKAQVGVWSIAVGGLEPNATFETNRWLTLSTPAREASDAAGLGLTVEVLRAASGIAPRALVGGSFEPQGSTFKVQVGSSGDLTLGAPRNCRSLLGRPLVAGLPEEFAQAALDGLARAVEGVFLPAGVLRINAGGYDESVSSPLAFERAAGAIAWVVAQRSAPSGLQAAGLVELIGAW